MTRAIYRTISVTAIIVALLLTVMALADPSLPLSDLARVSDPADQFQDPGFGADVLTLGSYNSDLVAAGNFFTADSSSAVRIAAWDGVSWYPFCCPSLALGPEVYTSHQYGPDLLVGAFGQSVKLHRWDGSAWGTLGKELGLNAKIFAIEEFQGQIVVGGTFRIDTMPIYKIAAWDGTDWDSLGSSVFGAGWTVYDMLVYDSNLIVGGSFSKAGGDTALAIAQWDGASWAPIGQGLWGPNTVQSVYTMTVFNDQLYAGGQFTKSGNTTLSNISYFNGVTWQPTLGGGLNGPVFALTVYDNKLIAGGRFHSAGSTPADYIAAWDGFSWTAMGTEIDSTVRALYVHNGTLIAGGSFSTGAGGYVAAWDGSAWQPVKDVVTDIPDIAENLLPGQFELAQNYPNPFNPSTKINFSLKIPTHAKLTVYDITGRIVITLVDRFMSAGEHSISWDGTNSSGNRVASGVYLYRLTANGSEQSKKMIMMK